MWEAVQQSLTGQSIIRSASAHRPFGRVILDYTLIQRIGKGDTNQVLPRHEDGRATRKHSHELLHRPRPGQ